MRLAALLLCCLAAPAACAKRAPPPPPRDEVLLVRDTIGEDEPPPQREGPLTQSRRDSLIREADARRAAWQARGIKNYRILVAAGCFCPWPGNPAILEVKDGVAVALRDTTGRSMGKPREPWSIYTVEGLFNAVVEHARRSADLSVRFDPRYDYPTSIRGTGRIGPPDSWFWVSATRLTPLR